MTESVRFASERDAIFVDVRRADEALFGLVAIVARAPERGEETPNPKIRAMRAEGWGLDPFILYYSFDGHTVLLESLRRAAEPQE